MNKDDSASTPDEENPEWTLEEVRRARPVLALFQEIYGEERGAEMLKRPRGRPAKVDRKINQTLRLDPDVVEAYRQEGNGWHARINQILRDNMPRRAR
jgi:uncharacterized protein (DUF4415 family)